jgi:hypothetical protein
VAVLIGTAPGTKPGKLGGDIEGLAEQHSKSSAEAQHQPTDLGTQGERGIVSAPTDQDPIAGMIGRTSF